MQDMQDADRSPPLALGAPAPVSPSPAPRRSSPVSDGILVLAVLALTLGGFFFLEKIELHDGLGWDGQFYGLCARDFSTEVLEKGVRGTSLGRVLPSAVVHYSLRLGRVPLTYPNIILAFGILNAALLTLTAFLWCRVADQLEISRGGKWLGAAGLFVNFGALRWFSYCPVQIDPCALAVGMGMLYCYLARLRWAVAALTVLGASFWPLLLCHGIPLLLFPRTRCPEGLTSPRFKLNTLLAFTFAAGAFAFDVYLLRKGHLGLQASWLADYCRVCLHLWQPLGPVSLFAAACVALYLFLALRGLWDCGLFFRPGFWLRSLHLRAILTVLLLLLAVRWLNPFPTSLAYHYNTHDLVRMLAWQSIRIPALPYVAHAVFFGPILILALLRWKLICRQLNAFGLGLTLCVTVNLLLSIDAESRHFFHFLPVVVAFVVKALDNVAWRARHYTVFALLSLLFSKIWLPIGGFPDATTDNVHRFPAQRLFMNLGPWMSHESFLLQTVVILLAGGLLYGMLRQGSGNTQGAEAPSVPEEPSPVTEPADASGPLAA